VHIPCIIDTPAGVRRLLDNIGLEVEAEGPLTVADSPPTYCVGGWDIVVSV